MLTDGLEKFQGELKNIIQDASTKAAEKAAQSMYNPLTLQSYLSQSGSLEENSVSDIQKKVAGDFGKVFGESFAEEIYKDLGKCIMDYIKTAGISIVHVSKGELAGTGAISGSIVINSNVDKISIL